MKPATYEAWADVLRYPGGGRAAAIPSWIDAIVADRPAATDDLTPLAAFAREHEEGEVEETFVRTFENNAERALELGWHLHGENYARGSFMVRLRGLLRDHAIEESSELPDHLSHVLLILARAEPELVRALARQVVLPALDEVLAGFEDGENPYRGALVALANALADEHARETAEAAR